MGLVGLLWLNPRSFFFGGASSVEDCLAASFGNMPRFKAGRGVGKLLVGMLGSPGAASFCEIGWHTIGGVDNYILPCRFTMDCAFLFGNLSRRAEFWGVSLRNLPALLLLLLNESSSLLPSQGEVPSPSLGASWASILWSSVLDFTLSDRRDFADNSVRKDALRICSAFQWCAHNRRTLCSCSSVWMACIHAA